MKQLMIILILVLSACGSSVTTDTFTEENCPIGAELEYYQWRDDFTMFQKLREGHVREDEFLTVNRYTGSWYIIDGENTLLSCGVLGEQTLDMSTDTIDVFNIDYVTDKTEESPEVSYSNCIAYYIYDGVETHTPKVPEDESLLIFECDGMGTNNLAYHWASWGF